MVPGRGHQYVISFICPSLAVCITSWPDAKSLRLAPFLVGEAVIVPSKAFAHRTYRSRSLTCGNQNVLAQAVVACHDHWNVSAPSRFTLYTLRAFSFALHFYRENPERQ